MRTISSATTPIIRYLYPTFVSAIALASILHLDRPISGVFLLAVGFASFYMGRKFCTVILTSDRILVRSGFTEVLLTYQDVASVIWRGKTDLVRINTRTPTALGPAVWFKAKVRWWVARPHPIVAELRQLCGLNENDSLE